QQEQDPGAFVGNDAPLFQLREAWPPFVPGDEGLEDGGRALVVCTIDVQLLTDTVKVMRSQIDLLRQTILDLRHTEAEEMVSLRGKIDSLEASLSGMSSGEQDIRPDDAKDAVLAKLAGRLQHLECAMWGGDGSVNADLERKPSEAEEKEEAREAAVFRTEAATERVEHNGGATKKKTEQGEKKEDEKNELISDAALERADDNGRGSEGVLEE
ncbi:unnamed protein product, partial [Laminaria digitata]